MDTLQNILLSMLSTSIDPTTAGIALAVIGLNIHFGYTGMLNIGQAGFMLLGAYGFAIATIHGLPMVVAVLIALGTAVVFALILGVPTLKLRGDYLAIVTISAAEIIRYVSRSSLLNNLTGGAQGLTGSSYQGPFISLSPLPNNGEVWTLSPFNYTKIDGGAGWVRLLGWIVTAAIVVGLVRAARSAKLAPAERRSRARLVTGGMSLLTAVALFFVIPVKLQDTGNNGWWVRIAAWFVVALSSLLLYALVSSPWGRLLRGIREDEDAMRSLGKNVFAVKMQALILGGLFGAAGGVVYVLATTVQPDSLGRNTTFLAYTALLLGGAATIFGPVLGSVLFFGARALVQGLSQSYLPNTHILNTQASAQLAYVVVGVGLMLLVIFRPQGLLGDKKELRFDV
jgi:neutral amino acid transport system permease protein